MRISLCILLVINSFWLLGQSGVIDSLKLSIEIASSDSARLDAQIRLANAYKNTSMDSANIYIEQARSRVDSSTLNRLWIDYNMALSNIRYVNGDVEASLDRVDRILDDPEVTSLNYTDRCDFNHRKALCLYKIAQYDEAAELLLVTLDTLSRYEDYGRMGGCYNSLGNVMRYIQRNDQSLQYYEKAYEYNTRAGDHGSALRNLASMATGYSMLDSFDRSIPLFKRAIVGSIEHEDPYLEAFAYGNLGLNYVDIEQRDSARHYLEKALEMYRSMNNQIRIARTSSQLSRLYLLEEKYTEAINILQPSLDIARETKNLELENAILVNLSKAYAGNRQYAKAYELSKSHGELTDSILTKEIREEVNNAQVKYETEKKEAEIKRLALEDELKQTRLRQQQWGLIGLAGVLALLAGLAYRLWQQKKAINQKNQENEALLKEIHHRVKNNLQVISSLLKLQSRSIDDEITQRVLLEGQDRVRSMALIHQNLYQDGNLRGINMHDYLSQLTGELVDNYQVGEDKVAVDIDVDSIHLDVDTVVPIGLIINELITNSLKYAFGQQSDPKIAVTLRQAADSLQLRYEDNGSGFDIDSLPAGSLGMRLIRSFANRLQAHTKWETKGRTLVSFDIRDFELAKPVTDE